jgi:hypothetical protein
VLAVGRIFEGQIGRVAVGQSVRVAVPSFPDRSFEGVVERLGGQLDPESRSLPVYVRVKNPEGLLRPNMRATLSVVTGRASAALAVPRGAVLGDFGALFAFVEREDEPTLFERRAVVTGLSDDAWVEILEGLLPGERVVVAGNYSLQFLPPAPAGAGEGEAGHGTGAPESAAGPGEGAQPAPPAAWRPGAALLVALAALLLAGVPLGIALRRRAARGRA